MLVDDVKLTFLKYPSPTFNPFVIYEQVPLLSVRQIAATKAYTIGRRGAYKDYIELYFILSEQHAPLAGIIDIIAFRVGEGRRQLPWRQLRFIQRQLHDLATDIVRNSVPDAVRPGRSVFQGFRPASLGEIAPSNGMDGSPSRPQVESLQQEGELQ